MESLIRYAERSDTGFWLNQLSRVLTKTRFCRKIEGFRRRFRSLTKCDQTKTLVGINHRGTGECGGKVCGPRSPTSQL